ncbi:protein of unknown function (plasmid) [Cupriavidus taiwanensis]|uniref:Uncharacterized protein n=1 Tax=Cupriavidus taiwanensis TaxID=164546 RepID=A0A375IT19_9BURK|nr:protein of unknown function [Cupriavidus taiwanensis]
MSTARYFLRIRCKIKVFPVPPSPDSRRPPGILVVFARSIKQSIAFIACSAVSVSIQSLMTSSTSDFDGPFKLASANALFSQSGSLSAIFCGDSPPNRFREAKSEGISPKDGSELGTDIVIPYSSDSLAPTPSPQPAKGSSTSYGDSAHPAKNHCRQIAAHLCS